MFCSLHHSNEMKKYEVKQENYLQLCRLKKPTSKKKLLIRICQQLFIAIILRPYVNTW